MRGQKKKKRGGGGSEKETHGPESRLKSHWFLLLLVQKMLAKSRILNPVE